MEAKLPVIRCTILFIPVDVTPEHRTTCQLRFREVKGKQGENEITSGSAIWKWTLFRAGCWKNGWETLCCISLELNKKKKEKTEGRAAFFSFSVIFVSERINCVRASILLTYIWALKAKQSLLWNYLFLAPHNIVPHCEEIQHLEKAKVWLKHRAALLFKGLGWIEEKRRKQEKKKKHQNWSHLLFVS